MTYVSSEVRRLALRSKYLYATIPIYATVLVCVVLQFTVLSGNKNYVDFTNVFAPGVMFGYLGLLYWRARKNLDSGRSPYLRRPTN